MTEAAASGKGLRWGLVSTAKICQDLVRSVRLYHPEAQFVAVASRTQEAADEFGKTFNIPRCYGSYEQLFQDPEIDAIYVATLNPFHKDPVIRALQAGKHVLCEKPFCMNASEATEMINVARAQKKFLMEGMWTRYCPAALRMNEIISSGQIGEIVSMRGQFGFELGGRDTDRLTKPELGGGALMDIGIYLLSFAFAVFRKSPSSVKSTSYFKGAVDWHTTVLLGYEKAQAVLDFGFDSEFYETQVFIIGTEGSIHVCHPFFAPTKLIVRSKSKGEEVLEFAVDKKDVKWNFSESASLYHEVKFLEDSVAAGKTESTLLGLDETLQIIQVADEIRKQISLVYPWDK